MSFVGLAVHPLDFFHYLWSTEGNYPLYYILSHGPFPQRISPFALRAKLWVKQCSPREELHCSAVIFGSCWASGLMFGGGVMPSPRAETHLGLSCLESHCRPELSRLEDQALRLTLSSPSTSQSILWQLLHCTGGISSLVAPGRSSRKYRVKFFHTSCCQTIVHCVWRIPTSSGKIPDFHLEVGWVKALFPHLHLWGWWIFTCL